jgi:hypothetical protein
VSSPSAGVDLALFIRCNPTRMGDSFQDENRSTSGA